MFSKNPRPKGAARVFADPLRGTAPKREWQVEDRGFVLDTEDVLRAFDSVTGAERWSTAPVCRKVEQLAGSVACIGEDAIRIFDEDSGRQRAVVPSKPVARQVVSSKHDLVTFTTDKRMQVIDTLDQTIATREMPELWWNPDGQDSWTKLVLTADPAGPGHCIGYPRNFWSWRWDAAIEIVFACYDRKLDVLRSATARIDPLCTQIPVDTTTYLHATQEGPWHATYVVSRARGRHFMGLAPLTDSLIVRWTDLTSTRLKTPVVRTLDDRDGQLRGVLVSDGFDWGDAKLRACRTLRESDATPPIAGRVTSARIMASERFIAQLVERTFSRDAGGLVVTTSELAAFEANSRVVRWRVHCPFLGFRMTIESFRDYVVASGQHARMKVEDAGVQTEELGSGVLVVNGDTGSPVYRDWRP